MQKKSNIFLIIALIASNATLWAQKKIQIEDIWQNYSFYPAQTAEINWMKDGQFYSANEGAKIAKFTVKDGKKVGVLADVGQDFQSYELNATEDKILLQNNIQSIYRRSSKADYSIFDIKTKKLSILSAGGAQSYATISPDGQKVAFVRNNDLFVVNLADMSEKQITTTGKQNSIINGSTDWVYEEEFAFAQAFAWSGDSKKIAFYTFDETNVKEYNMQMWNNSYPTDYRFKYPKVGEENSKITISVVDMANFKITKMDIGSETDIYIPRINWTKDANTLSIRRMNRLQNKLEILHANASTGASKIILTEEEKTYVDVEFTDDLRYLENGKQFLHTSERDGFKHIYLYEMSGKLIRQITKGNFEISKIEGVDEKNSLIYLTCTKDSPLERQLYVTDFSGKDFKKLSTQKGTHSINMSPDCSYFVDSFSDKDTPFITSLHEAKTGKSIKVLEDNKALNEKMKAFSITKKEFFTFKNESGIELNGWMIKPANSTANASAKSPVLMFVYGGPGSQEVDNKWDFFDFFWYQHLVSKGYVVACVDNRGTGGRGAAFRKSTYGQLGKLEVEDQIDAAKYLGGLPFVDKNRIGIWGWSYGGYMSSLCILKGNDVFKAAMAVAPVTTWRFYDTIYTERYLKRPQDNAAGYDENSPITHVDKLKGKYLLVHGTGDDNVHFQNAVIMQDALIKANKQFESFYYPNKNHGISGGNTRLHLYKMLTNFLDKSL